jgi:molybdopterin-guanine dinucleotide biosynthesis protein A
VLELIFSVIADWDAVVPRYPGGYIEPLHAVYRTAISRKVIGELLSSGKRSMKDLITRLKTLYLSTETIKQLDPELKSFTNINTIDELQTAERIINRED